MAVKKRYIIILIIIAAISLLFLARLTDMYVQDLETNERVVATFTPESRTCFQYNPPTIMDDFIYIGTSTKIIDSSDHEEYLASLPDNYFYKMDLDLNVVWEYPLQKTMVYGGSTLDSNDNIYFVTITFYPSYEPNPGETMNYLTKMELYSLTNNGTFRWKEQISYEGEKWRHAMLNCAIGTDDTIYVGDSKLFAFYTNGSIKWQYPDNNYIITNMRTSPIIDSEGNIYFISPEPRESMDWTTTIGAYKFTPDSNGAPVWSTILDNNPIEKTDEYGASIIYSTPSFLKDQKSFYAAVGNTINHVDTETGNIIWSTIPEDITGEFKASAAVDENNTLYIGTKANEKSILYAIKSDGTLLWMKEMNADLYPSPLIGDDGNIYIGSETTDIGKFYSIDKENGELQWVIGRTFPDSSFGSPALKNGYVYLGGNEVRSDSPLEKAFYKIKVDANNYPPDAAWPRYHGSNENTGRKN